MQRNCEQAIAQTRCDSKGACAERWALPRGAIASFAHYRGVKVRAG
jgi:hypothetical protein